METNEFEKYLEKVCFEANPTILDDDMPDFFDDWLGSQNADDFIRLGNAFCEDRVKKVFNICGVDVYLQNDYPERTKRTHKLLADSLYQTHGFTLFPEDTTKTDKQ